ncbi:MAG TPA: hypothetical protein VLG38_01885 [Gammaproteobacteria bacterium]|nr:hypothetical protein [Gammaproteobacteria bacterium]
MLKKILLIIASCTIAASSYALTPQDPKYCKILDEVKPGMDIGNVFLIMGPPHTFGQPPDLTMSDLTASPPMQPQNNVAAQSKEEQAAQILKSMANDPILGAFMRAPSDTTNMLMWNFENDTLTVSVKVKGPTVTDVNTNFSCS